MKYFCYVINSKEAYIVCVLPIKANSSRRLQNVNNEKEVSVASPSPCNLFVNEHLHVGENKIVYTLSDNSLY